MQGGAHGMEGVRVWARGRGGKTNISAKVKIRKDGKGNKTRWIWEGRKGVYKKCGVGGKERKLYRMRMYNGEKCHTSYKQHTHTHARARAKEKGKESTHGHPSFTFAEKKKKKKAVKSNGTEVCCTPGESRASATPARRPQWASTHSCVCVSVFVEGAERWGVEG